jgi:hypothetical protein
MFSRKTKFEENLQKKRMKIGVYANIGLGRKHFLHFAQNPKFD